MAPEVRPFLTPFARTLARTLPIEKHGSHGILDDRRCVVVNDAVITSNDPASDSGF
jgi:hypothetical protein